MKFKDLTGEKYGRWTVLSISHKKVHRYYNCVCECGTEKTIQGPSLTSGTSVSCGCYRDESSKERFTKHGMCDHPAYQSWTAMRRRCQDPNFIGYERYGAVGITVYDQWQTFEGFWADMGSTWAEDLSIDRKDGTKGYYPENCRWATIIEQNNNQRTNLNIQTEIGVLNRRQAAEYHKISEDTLKWRIANWPRDRWFEPVWGR